MDFARSIEPGRPGQLDRLAKLSPAGDASGWSGSRELLTGSAARRTGCRPCSTSPEPTARARPAPSCAPRSRRRGYKRPRLHQPAPRPLQRAHPGRRAADRRRDAGGASCRGRRGRRGHRAKLLRSRDRGRASSPSRARRPTPASSRSGSAAGSTRPTSSTSRWSLRHRQPRRSTISSSSATGSPDIAAEKAGDRQAGRAAHHPALPARDRRAGRKTVASQAGAIWLAARRQVGRDRQLRQASLSRLAGRARAAGAAPARAPSGDERGARGGNAPPPGQAARADRGDHRGDGLGRLAGAAPASRARALWSGQRDVWLDGGHNPSRGAPDRLLRPPRVGRRQAAPHRLRKPCDQGPARHASAVPRSRGAMSMPCRSRTTPASFRANWWRLPPCLAFPPRRMTVSPKRLQRLPSAPGC